MKVKELVERLTDYDDDCEVFFPDCAPVVECLGHYNKITKKTEVFLTDYDENEGDTFSVFYSGKEHTHENLVGKYKIMEV